VLRRVDGCDIEMMCRGCWTVLRVGRRSDHPIFMFVGLILIPMHFVVMFEGKFTAVFLSLSIEQRFIVHKIKDTTSR
jgi:hypothetical protein